MRPIFNLIIPHVLTVYSFRLNTRQALRGKGYECDSLSLSNPTSSSSRSTPTPQLGGGNTDRGLRFGRGMRDGPQPHELSDLRAAWPSQAGTRESADSVVDINSDPTMNKSTPDIAIPVVVSDVEAQNRSPVRVFLLIISPSF